MTILGIEASGQVASVAIVTDGVLRGEYTMNHKKTHSETLLPMIDTLLKRTETELASVDAIAVSAGPGSFTGLRIGSATAKGLALVEKIPIVSVPTVDALAFNLWGSDKLICPIIDARRHQVYTGFYYFAGDKLEVDTATRLVLIEDLIAEINEKKEAVVFLGDASLGFHDYIVENCKVPVSFAPASRREQSAASVATLGGLMFEAGICESATEHKPNYLRPSQAERELGDKAKDFRI